MIFLVGNPLFFFVCWTRKAEEQSWVLRYPATHVISAPETVRAQTVYMLSLERRQSWSHWNSCWWTGRWCSWRHSTTADRYTDTLMREIKENIGLVTSHIAVQTHVLYWVLLPTFIYDFMLVFILCFYFNFFSLMFYNARVCCRPTTWHMYDVNIIWRRLFRIELEFQLFKSLAFSFPSF